MRSPMGAAIAGHGTHRQGEGGGGGDADGGDQHVGGGAGDPDRLQRDPGGGGVGAQRFPWNLKEFTNWSILGTFNGRKEKTHR